MGNSPKQILGKKGCLEFLKLYSKHPEHFEVEKIFVKPNFSKEILKEICKFKLENKIEYKSIDELDQITKENHQGIILYFHEKKEVLISLKNGKSRPPKTIAIKKLLQDYPGIYVLTDNVQDPHNLGSIIRSSEALGAMGIFITGKGARINDTVQKVATSSLIYIPAFEYANALNLILEAKKQSYWILATSPKESEKTIFLYEMHKLPKDQKYILMVGSEGDGIKDILLKEADFWLKIPQLGHTESLNVHQALSITLYKLIEYLYYLS